MCCELVILSSVVRFAVCVIGHDCFLDQLILVVYSSSFSSRQTGRWNCSHLGRVVIRLVSCCGVWVVSVGSSDGFRNVTSWTFRMPGTRKRFQDIGHWGKRGPEELQVSEGRELEGTLGWVLCQARCGVQAHEGVQFVPRCEECQGDAMSKLPSVTSGVGAHFENVLCSEVILYKSGFTADQIYRQLTWFLYLMDVWAYDGTFTVYSG